MSLLNVAILSVISSAYSYELSNGIGRLPAMGWNSWNAYQCASDAEDLMTAANALVSKGFKAVGYEYVIQDDCWSVKSGRDNFTHQIIPDPTKFPNGIIGVANQVHDLGLKFGIYSSAGVGTCAGYPGSIGFEQVDAETFAGWGVDYLKYDNCGIPQEWFDTCFSCVPDSALGQDFVNGTCTSDSNEWEFAIASVDGMCNYEWPVDGVDFYQSYTGLRYRVMQNALLAQNRTILYSLCEWGLNEPWTWGNRTAQSWRTTGDITPEWSRIAEILNMNSFLSNWTGFTGHNDLDMLEVGNGELTVQETRSHFAMWAINKAPLLIGTNLTALSKTNIQILQNKYLIAFNQDPGYGAPAQPYKWGINPNWTFNATNPAEYWAGSSSNGVLVAMLNTLSTTQRMIAKFDEIPDLEGSGPFVVTNAWTGKNMGCISTSVAMSIESHDTAVLLIQQNADCA